MSMIAKGLVSAIYESENKLSVILPENNGIVTPPFKIYNGNKQAINYEPNDFVLVVLFNDEFSDGIILGI